MIANMIAPQLLIYFRTNMIANMITRLYDRETRRVFIRFKNSQYERSYWRARTVASTKNIARNSILVDHPFSERLQLISFSIGQNKADWLDCVSEIWLSGHRVRQVLNFQPQVLKSMKFGSASD